MTSRSPIAPFRSFPDDVAERYRQLGYWTDETFAEFIEDRAARFADRIAVRGQNAHGEDQIVTYATFAARARAAAAHLRDAHGVQPGDRVVVALPNTTEFVDAVFGLFRLGAIPIFAMPTHREIELTLFCVLADAAALIVARGAGGVDHDALFETIASQLTERGVTPPRLIDVTEWRDAIADDAAVAMPDADVRSLALLQLSGGTTGVAKLIPRTHADYLYSVRASAEICELTADDVQLVVLPAGHNFAMSSAGILGFFDVGGSIVLAPDPSPRTAFRLIESAGVTHAALVPPLAQAWVASARRRPANLESLRVLQVGGAKLADSVAPEIESVLGVALQQVFGMAEGLVNYTRSDDPRDLVHTTQGRPISVDDEIRIVDEADQDVPAGADGMLLTRGPYTIRGYYGSPHADEESFTEDGFYRTGDIVRRLPSGHFVVTGRAKEQINRGGEKIAVDELESLALAHRGVLDAVAVGVEDRFLGERIVLVVRSADEQPRADALLDFLRGAGLATYKIPDQVVFVDELPSTHIGKNSRREVRRLLAGSIASHAAGAEEHA